MEEAEAGQARSKLNYGVSGTIKKVCYKSDYFQDFGDDRGRFYRFCLNKKLHLGSWSNNIFEYFKYSNLLLARKGLE